MNTNPYLTGGGGEGWLLHNFLKIGKNFNAKDRRSLETKISVL